jgi:hypothetical protein
MSNGMCTNGVLKCFVCKQVWAGFTTGGYYKDCEFCSNNGECDYQQQEKEPMRTSYRLCPTCLMYLVPRR